MYLSRLSISCIANASFLAGALVVCTAPQLVSEAQAGKKGGDEEPFVAPPKKKEVQQWEYYLVQAPAWDMETANAMGAEG